MQNVRRPRLKLRALKAWLRGFCWPSGIDEFGGLLGLAQNPQTGTV